MHSDDRSDDDRELVRQVRGEVIGEVERGENYAWRLLRAARLRCQAGARAHDALECVACPRFVNFLPTQDRKSVTIRCQWTEDDCVGAVMQLAVAALRVTPQTRLATADARARLRGVRHMLVFEQGDLVGVACRCRLVPPILENETVADRMSTNFVTLKPWATLEEAATLMAEERTGCVPIVAEGKVHGVITRGELLRMGVPLDRFGIEPCERCGGDHAGKPHPQLANFDFCLDCLDRVLTPSDYAAIPSTPEQ